MNLIKTIAIYFIKFYQKVISPYSSGCCRFTPTCSNYAIEAYTKYNFFKASLLSLKRILKCHPFGGKGYDPID